MNQFFTLFVIAFSIYGFTPFNYLDANDCSFGITSSYSSMYSSYQKTKGTLYIDEIPYPMQDEATYRAFIYYCRGFEPKYRVFFSDVINALNEGKDIRIDTFANSISGVLRFSALTDAQNRRAFKKTGRTRIERFFDAQTDSPINRLAEAIYLLGRFQSSRN